MAKYPSISQTKNGRILIAKSNATGKALKPIKVVAGDGQLTNQNIETMENVINPLLELPFASPGRFVKDGQFQLDFALSNEHLEHGFYAREIGVFAKLDGEDDSTAVMIAYTNGGNFVDYIPAKDTPINSKVFEVTIAVDNAANVIVQRSDAAYITAGEMERHNESEHAHDDRFDAIIQQVNNMITQTDDGDKQTLAPTLALVKQLIKEHNNTVDAHDNLLQKIKQLVLDMMTWKNVPGLTKVGHFSFSNALKEIPLPTGWRRLKVCVAWNGDTTDFNKFTQNMFPRLLEPNNGAVREFDVMQVKLSNNKQFSVLDEDGFGYTINESKLIITSAGKDGNDYIVAMYYM